MLHAQVGAKGVQTLALYFMRVNAEPAIEYIVNSAKIFYVGTT
jgi:hypothetical protein